MSKKVKLEELLTDYFKQKVYSTIRNKQDEFMVIRNGNLEFYQAKKKLQGYKEILDSIDLIEKFPLSDISHVTIDYFTISATYSFSNKLQIKVIYKDMKEKKEIESILVDFGLSVKVIKRKWYNKILGFRSKKKWKMAIALIGYPLLIYVNIVGFFNYLENVDNISQEQAVAREEKAKKKEERESEQQALEENKGKTINEFKDDGFKKVIEEFNIVRSIDVEDSINLVFFDVYVDEESWSDLTKSKKTSLAATLETYIEKELDPYSISMDIYSDSNEDKLAKRTLIRNRWEIIR